MIFWGWLAVCLLWVYRILQLWFCSCCIDFNMFARLSKIAFLKNTRKIENLTFPFFKNHPFSFLAVDTFRQPSQETSFTDLFPIGVALRKHCKNRCFWLRYVLACFRALFWVFEFWRFFFVGFGRPLKTLKKPKKIITFWLASNFLSIFWVVVLSSSRRCRIGPKRGKKRPEVAALKKHRENWYFYFCRAPRWPFLVKNKF